MSSLHFQKQELSVGFPQARASSEWDSQTSGTSIPGYPLEVQILGAALDLVNEKTCLGPAGPSSVQLLHLSSLDCITMGLGFTAKTMAQSPPARADDLKELAPPSQAQILD